ncbi:MAG TPA: 5'/3'-nucleotidase SurE [Dehalococcoidia bacterium]|nr:5'/3'-nucleotidase SurE [Dehalococcoidia bacterium]
MKILVTNDDGMHSRGLWALADALSEVGDVTLIAPDREQSGVGTSITIRRELRLNRLPRRGKVAAYSLEGTPSDCVLLAIGDLMRDGIDLIVSGINEGANVGDNILMSGTVGAALQGYFHDISSIAISVAELRRPEVGPSARTAAVLARGIAAGWFGPGTVLLNVNLPNLPADKLTGAAITDMAHRAYTLNITREKNVKGHDVCKVGGQLHTGPLVEGTDAWAIRNGLISISPIDHSFQFQGDRDKLDGLAETIFEGIKRGGTR